MEVIITPITSRTKTKAISRMPNTNLSTLIAFCTLSIITLHSVILLLPSTGSALAPLRIDNNTSRQGHNTFLGEVFAQNFSHNPAAVKCQYTITYTDQF